MEPTEPTGEHSSVIDQIKSGELVGRDALDRLAVTGEYVFHGTQTPGIKEFELRQAHNNNEPDGTPAVFATPLVETATFMAVMKDKGHSAWDIHAGDPATVTLYASEAAIARAKETGNAGYVYVFSSFTFEPYRGLEVVSRRPVRPVLSVPVTFDDIKEPIYDYESKYGRNG